MFAFTIVRVSSWNLNKGRYPNRWRLRKDYPENRNKWAGLVRKQDKGKGKGARKNYPENRNKLAGLVGNQDKGKGEGVKIQAVWGARQAIINARKTTSVDMR